MNVSKNDFYSKNYKNLNYQMMETIDSEEEIIINSENSFNCENCELMKHEFDSLYGILRKEKIKIF